MKIAIGWNRRTLAVTGAVVMAFLPPAILHADDRKEADHLYQEARRLTITQQWDKAVGLYQRFLNRFTENSNQDDALFWIAYCMEKKSGASMEAYQAYDELICQYPNSPWVDDAVVHQILMVEQFVREGREQYRPFLLEKLADEDVNIRRQAALALGSLRDERALPSLQEMLAIEDFKIEAGEILKRMKTPPRESPAREAESAIGTGDLQFKVETEKKPAPEMQKEKKSVFPFFETRRHQLYKSMLKTDGTWTRDERINFGMWTVLSTDQFEALAALKGYDRLEWLRKYWKLRDPTPTTEINECRDEFEQRVEYAWENFSETWNYRNFKVLQDQYLRDGWPHAPWDARGEIYILYGEPESISIAGFNEEEWAYNRYRIDFIVERYRTNIYKDAIRLGPLSQELYADNPEWAHYNFIENREFRYTHNYHAKPFKSFKPEFRIPAESDTGRIAVVYTIPTGEFKISRQEGGQGIAYNECWVVLDEDMREVVRRERSYTVTRPEKKEIKNLKTVSGRIPLDLPPGQYLFALEIKDLKNPRLGLYVETFEVR
ncbi:GWxTD domain-containing protein [bacterium]|nr:GWxTD domain-containing protein [bacterium]